METKLEYSEDASKEDDPLKGAKIEKSCKSVTDSVRHAFRTLSVEPSVIMLVFSSILTYNTSLNLYMDKACRVNLNFTKEICDALKKQNATGLDPYYENDVMKLSAAAITWNSYLITSLPSIFAVFIGSWTDRTGRRKMFLIIPIFGAFLTCVSNIVNTYFFNELSLEVLVFSEAIIDSLSGSWCIGFLMAFSYLSAITNDDTRTLRLGILNYCIILGYPIGMAISGPLLKYNGYFVCYGLAAILHAINLLYTCITLKDTKWTKEQELVSRFFEL